MAPQVAAGGAIARFEGTNAHQPYFFFGRMGAWWVIAMFEVRRTIAFQVLRRAASTVLVISAFVLAVQVQARWKPEYASQPPEVQQWYRNAELTAAAQARFRFKKCCDHADVVKTKFNVNRTTSGDEWFWLDGETWRRIPDDIIHWDQRAPSGQPTLFVYSGRETCFFPGDGGI